MNISQPFILLLSISLIISCKEDPPQGPDVTPVVAVHGFLGTGDTWTKHFQRFSSLGFPEDHLFTFDYNSFAEDEDIVGELDAFIDLVLQNTGADFVNLMGHSKGGGVSYIYLEDVNRASKVNRYAHVASFLNTELPGPDDDIPTLNLWSPDDAVIDPKGNIPGAVNTTIPGADHLEVATVDASFEAIYEFFTGDFPASAEIIQQQNPQISGKVLAFGENNFTEGAVIEIWATDASSGAPLQAEPEATFSIGADGKWGPFSTLTDVQYCFHIHYGTRDIIYYREPFLRNDHQVYLRTLPPPLSIPGFLLAGIPQDDAQTVVVVLSQSAAVIAGRDELSVDGFDLATEEFASADQSTIAYFLFDDGDSTSSGDADPAFADFPFLNGVDIFMSTTPDSTINTSYNGRSINIKNWKSATDGPVVVVYD